MLTASDEDLRKREYVMIATSISKRKLSFSSPAGWLPAIGAMGLFCSAAHAGPYHIYGSEFAWVNNFNNSTINSTFSTNSVPGMTVSYNFSGYNLYGYPAIIRGWHYCGKVITPPRDTTSIRSFPTARLGKATCRPEAARTSI